MLDMIAKFDGMTLKELRQLQKELGAAIDEKVEQEMDAAKAKIQEMAAEIGCQPSLLIDVKPGRAPARKKYGDGEGNYWTGKGRIPTWLQDKLDAGAKVDEFLLEPE